MALPSFWADPKITYAKRNHIFVVQFDFGLDMGGISSDTKKLLKSCSGIQYAAQSVNLPSFSIGQKDDRNPNGGGEKIVQPEQLDWTPIKLTFSDFVERGKEAKTTVENNPEDGISKITTTTSARGPRSLYAAMMSAFHESFGRDPRIYQGGGQINYGLFRKVFKNITIMSMDSDGNFLDQWVLKSPWPVSFENSTLSYEDEGIRTFAIELDYITAEYTFVNFAGRQETLFTRVEGAELGANPARNNNVISAATYDTKNKQTESPVVRDSDGKKVAGPTAAR
jgi:hypothetical protein